jgi:acyl-coenzyme A synthetase/AMP-(fatty) acid ligase
MRAAAGSPPDLPGITTLKPGSATRPFPGVEAEVVDDRGKPATSGYLVLKKPWPGMLRAIWGDPERYVQQYWSKYPGSTSRATGPSGTGTDTTGCWGASMT